MSSARHTPRYVSLISEEPIGPQLVESEPETKLGPKLIGPQPLRRRDSAARHVTEVIPLRPMVQPAPAEQAGTAKRNARRAAPVAERPWKVLIMSPSADSRTRSFDLARWQARVVLAAVTITLLLSGSFIAAVVTAVRSPELVLIGDEATEMRAKLAATEDSLNAAREEIGLRDEAAAVADSLSTAMVISSDAPRLKSPLAGHGRRPNLSALLAPTSSSGRTGGSSAGMGLPVIGVIASQFSRARWHPILHITRAHLGLDLAAPKGTTVTAPAPGVVMSVERSFTMGLVVEIRHANDVRSRYLHLSAASVHVGQHVLRGTPIAAVGSTGLATGPHLHYEVYVRGHPVNPLHYRYAANEAAAAAAADAASALANRSPLVAPTGMGGSHDDSAANSAPR
jgi:murein DD-endopeptidase MepM/ murein hydrolase activator NlpD